MPKVLMESLTVQITVWFISAIAMLMAIMQAGLWEVPEGWIHGLFMGLLASILTTENLIKKGKFDGGKAILLGVAMFGFVFALASFIAVTLPEFMVLGSAVVYVLLALGAVVSLYT